MQWTNDTCITFPYYLPNYEVMALVLFSDEDNIMKDYLAAQEELNAVLDAPDNNNEKPLPDVFVHKKKNR